MGSSLPKSRFHHLPTYFSKLLFILYKFPLYIRCSSTLAYTVNKCTLALWLRFISLPWRRVSGELNLGYLSLMPPPGSTGKLQAPRGTRQASCVGAKSSMHRALCLGAEQLYSLGQHRILLSYLGQIVPMRQDVSKTLRLQLPGLKTGIKES